METVELILNPVRQRIFQYLLIHGKATVKELRKALPDVPTASLYRHVNLLSDRGVIRVVEENRIRGTVESVYAANREVLKTDDRTGLLVQSILMGLCGQFAAYFAREDADPVKDMLLISSCTLELTDEEYGEFLGEINALTAKYMERKADPQTKLRHIALVSAPGVEV